MSDPQRPGELVSLVIPIDNPSVDVRALAAGYAAPFREHGYEYELVFVLDGVHRNVLETLNALAAELPVKVVRLQGAGLGESIALSAGAARARGSLILSVPQYHQVEPEDLLKVVQSLETGADFVATWRHPRVDPWLNRLQSTLFNWVLRVVMGIRFHDLNSGVRGMRRQVLEEVNVYGELFRFLPVLAQRQGFKVVEIKVRHREERGTIAFYGIGVYVRRVLDILAISFLTRFTQRPLRFFGILGVLAILIGVALCVEPLYAKVFEAESLANRPAFVLGVILAAFGVQLIGLGVIGEIIIFTQAGQMRDYKVDEVLGGEPEDRAAPNEDAELEEHEDLAAVGANGVVRHLGTGASGDAPAASGARVAAGDGADGNGADAPAAAVGLPTRVRELLPGEDAHWDSFVRDHPQGSFFHLSGWRRVVEETFHHQAHYLVCERGRAWCGLLPLFFVRSPFIGKQLISVPYAVYGGLLVRELEFQQPLLDAAAQYGRRLGASYLELRHLEARPGERVPYELYVTFRKQLPATVEEVLPAIPKKARAEVRRARDKFNLVCETTDQVELFFSLFAEEKRRLGTPSLPLRWFQNLKEEFGNAVVIHVVKDQSGAAQCAVLSFVWKDTIYAYYSGSSADSRGKGVSDFAYCQIMEWAIARGLRNFDFGRSRRETGAAKFKEHMGFEPERLNYDFLLLHEGAKLPDFHPSNPKLEGPRRLWSKLPRGVATRIGGRLSRYLP
ncbi:MAG: FemAB family PEP-CTERM system-associated protein [Planctomycetes bacterium]|nr:FemAB family PEP-CTERM system-associated protein [Planctomycetota bacterium]